MKIVYFLHAPPDPLSAVFGHASAQAAALRERGHQVSIKTESDFPTVLHVSPRWRPIFYPRAIARWLQPGRADLAIFHSFCGWAHSSRRGGAVAITDFHGVEPLYHRAVAGYFARRNHPLPLRHRIFQERVMPLLLSRGCRQSQAVFCRNRAERDFILRRRWTTADRVHIVRSPVARDFFMAREYPGEVRSLLFVGQWLEAKGTENLAAAFQYLVERHPAIRLLCVGTRTPPDAVLADFHPAVRNLVTVVPEASRAEIIGQLAGADAFVFPSLSEGSSLALLEAMAAALPIVATGVGAAPDLLENGKSALLVPSDDVDALTSALVRLASEAPLRRQLGRSAQDAARRHAGEQAQHDILSLIEGVLAEESKAWPPTR